MPDLFTETVGAWRRTEAREMPAPPGVERLRAASYEGPGKLDVRVYQLASPAMALDMVRQWKASRDTVFFYKDRFFVVIKWQASERGALREFVGGLQKKFPM